MQTIKKHGEKVKLVLGITYFLLPFFITGFFKFKSNYVLGVYENVSQLGIVFVLLLFHPDRQENKKSNMAILAFAAVLFADFAYMLTIGYENRTSLPLFYLSDFLYFIFFILFTYYLFKGIFIHLNDRISKALFVITNLTCSVLVLRYVLLPIFYKPITLNTYWLCSSAVFSAIEIFIVSLIIPYILRTLKMQDLLFLLALLLLCISDFCIRYEIGFAQFSTITMEFGWAASMGLFFLVILYYKSLPKFSADSLATINSIRTYISILILIGLCLFIVLLHFLKIYPVSNIFSFSNVMIIIYLLWFVSNYISLKISNAVINVVPLNLQYLDKACGKFKYQPIDNKNRIFETKSIIEHYNQLAEDANLLSAELAQKARFAAIGQTTAMIAHDIKRPFSLLKSTLSFFEVFKKDAIELNKAQAEIEKALANVESMLRNIIDFSKEINLSIKPTSLIELINSSIRQVAQDYPYAEIAFKYNIKSTWKLSVDDQQIGIATSNIIDNAVGAITVIGKKRIGVISIRSSNVSNRGKEFVEIVIGNNGPYMNEGDIPRLFDCFFTKNKKTGTGLGLASVKKIIEQHGGFVLGRNIINGEGVEFVIQLPAAGETESFDMSILPTDIKEALGC